MSSSFDLQGKGKSKDGPITSPFALKRCVYATKGKQITCIADDPGAFSVQNGG